MEDKRMALWLKLVLVGTAICAVVVYGALLPAAGRFVVAEYPEAESCFWPWMIFLWATALPGIGIWALGWCIAGNIGAHRAFCSDNAVYLARIALLAGGDGVFFLVGNLLFFALGMHHPSPAIFSLMAVFAAAAVAVAAAVLSALTRRAAGLPTRRQPA